MERESFEDEEIAFLMNEKYVSIKVDREERPDVDQMYMTFIQVKYLFCQSTECMSASLPSTLSVIKYPGPQVKSCSTVQFLSPQS